MWSFTAWGARGLPATALLAALTVGCTDPNPSPTDEEAVAPAVAARGDRYIVLLKDGGESGLRAEAMRADVGRLGGSLQRAHAEIGVLQVGGLTATAAAQVARQADVEAVVKDRVFQLIRPGKRRAHDARGVDFGGESNQRDAVLFDRFQWNLRRIQAPRAWDVSRQGAGVTVCILDSGVDPRHLDLTGKLDLGISASFVAEERADRDVFSHGTDMASIVSSNGILMASVAPDARLCSVKVLDRRGEGTFGDLIAGIMYVGTTGVDVANMSVGALFPRNDPDIRALARATQRAVNFSTRRGVLFVATAGNQAADLNTPDLIHLPSDLDNVVASARPGRSTRSASIASRATRTSVARGWTCSPRAGSSRSPITSWRT